MAARVRASPNPKRKAEQRRSSKSEARDRRDRVQASPIPTKKSGAQPSGEVLSALGRPLYPLKMTSGWVGVGSLRPPPGTPGSGPEPGISVCRATRPRLSNLEEGGRT